MKSHFSPVRFGELLSRDDLQEEHKFETIAKILLYVLYLGPCLS